MVRGRNIATALVTAAVALGVSCSGEDNPAPTVVPRVAGPDGQASTEAGCPSDAATCNSCVSPVDDPYAACSEAAAGCIPFDNDRRLPKDPSGGLPPVP